MRTVWRALLLVLTGHLSASRYSSLAFADHRVRTGWNQASWNDKRAPHSRPTIVLRGGSNFDPENSPPLPEPFPAVDLPQEWANGPKKAIIFVDKFCPYFGFYMSKMANDMWGAACINVFSDYMKGYFLKEHPGQVEPLAMCRPDKDHIEEWLTKLPQIDEIVGIICESDSGLADAEKLAEQLLVVKNHNGVNEARRNKYLMNNACSRAGLATVRQRLCTTVEEATEFAKELGVTSEDANDMPNERSSFLDEAVNGERDSPLGSVPEDEIFSNRGVLGGGLNTPSAPKIPLCVVKPIRGAASDCVFLCGDLSYVKHAFDVIHGSSIFGSPREEHEAVLVQEFASGTEYALDIVSRDGEHKVAALWRYDKRPANFAPFVYHATEMIDGNNEEARIICDYAKNALDALDLKWGMSHTEVIVDKEHGPRLVEVNCRQHNTDFAPLAMACLGYNALDMTLSAYLGVQSGVSYDFGDERQRLDWDGLPDLPVTRAYGAIVHLVSFVQGKLIAINDEALQEISQMESVLELEVYPTFLKLGSTVGPTIDMRTDAGWVQIINDNRDVFMRDYERIVELMPSLFIVE